MKKLLFISIFIASGMIVMAQQIDNLDANSEQQGDTSVVQDKTYDSTTGMNEVLVGNPEYLHRTSVSGDLLSGTPHELTNSFTDAGSEIPTDTYKTLTLWINVDIGTSTDVELRVLFKHTSAGAEEYRQIYLGNPGSNLTTVSTNDYQFDSDSDQLVKISIDVTGVKYVQLQFQDAADGDGQIDTLYYTLTN